MTKADVDEPDAATCALYFKALGDPVRLRIIQALQVSALSVSDLAELLDLDIAKVSHHLRVLFHAEIVTSERDGKYIYYALNQAFLKTRAARQSLDFGCCKIDLRA